MFKYLIELLKGLFLEIRGAKVHSVAPGFGGPPLMEYEPAWDVRLVEYSTKVRVFDLKERENRPSLREGCFRVKIEADTLPLPVVAASMKGSLPLFELPEVSHQFMVTEPSLLRAHKLEASVLSNLSLPPLWKKRVRREVRVEREKIERALRVLQDMIEKEELKNVAFSGYFKNVPSGTVKITGNDLIVDIDRKSPRSRALMVFRILTKDGKSKHVFIFLD